MNFDFTDRGEIVYRKGKKFSGCEFRGYRTSFHDEQ